jgi:hypothetical protein
MAELPADSIYRETVKVSLLGEIAQLWKRSSEVARSRRQEANQRSSTLPMPAHFDGSRMAADGKMIPGNRNDVAASSTEHTDAA